MENTIYSQPVLDITQEVIQDLHKSDFFNKEECTTQAAETILNKLFSVKFIAAEPLMFSSDDEIKETLGLIILESTFGSLMEKGLIDMISDESGNRIPFVTEDGEAVIEAIKKEE